ncbi:MAG TPA: hypothetical protein VH597_14395 [Verrucomicrobiae bacterium]|jgi:hypothetical protein|nr:hypothetical protein [Verrucomicrobiae bacterium]
MRSEEKYKSHVNLFLERTKLVMIVAIVVGSFPRTGKAAEESKTNALSTKTVVDASDPLGSLRREADAVDAAHAAYSNETDEAQKDKFWKAYVQTNDSLIPKILDGVRQFPTSPTAFGLLEWVLSNGRISAASLVYTISRR